MANPGLQQRVLWIALPNGVTGEGGGRRLRLSVFVSPRLRPQQPSTLAHFPDFLTWAGRMQPGSVSLEVQVENGPVVPAELVSPSPDPQLWAACFGPDTPVHEHTFDDYADRPIVTYPVRFVLQYMKDRYQEIAARSPDDLPTEAWLSGAAPPEGAEGLIELVDSLFTRRFEGVQGEEDLSNRLARRIEAARDTALQRRARHAGAPIEQADGAPIVAGDGGTVAGAFEQAMLFHYRPANAQPVDLPASEEEARAHFEGTVDFHQMLSALGDYPELLRRLGLVFDLELPAGSIPSTPYEPFGKLRVVPAWTSDSPAGTSIDYSPWTVYASAEVDGTDLFIPISRDGEIAAGLWTPPVAEVDLVQVDTDGAALKTLNTAGTLARLSANADDRGIDAPDASGLATLRTGGVSIVRSGHAAGMNAGFNRSHNLNVALESDPPQFAGLYAEDLLRGYRVDVLDGRTGRWHSLHARAGTYTFTDGPVGVLEISDEGIVQLGLTEPPKGTSSPPDPSGELYIHESLVTWDGWSLSAPRPGRSISRSPRAPVPDDPETQPQRVHNTPMTSLRMETSFRAQSGSLPRLRFGGEYRVRARAVDLAGNSPSMEGATELAEQVPGLHAEFPSGDALLFRRFEPVAAPVLAPRAEYTEGESAERLVIRSNHDVSAEGYAAAHPPYLGRNDRHVVAPKASLQLVETHGLLDAALDARADGLTEDQVRTVRREAYELARREKGSLAETSLPTVVFVETRDGEGYAVHNEEQLQLPYLPDPLASGAMFVGLPGVLEASRAEVGFGGAAWHEATPFRLRLGEGGGPPDWDAGARVLTVFLAKGEIARVRMSSVFGGDLQQMGLWRWLEEAAEQGKIAPDRLDELARAVQESRHWMFTPFRDLTLVHAVQQPLAAPEAASLQSLRGAAETAAHLRGEVYLHVPSTAKLDLRAEWSEHRDDLSKSGPETVEARAHVHEITVSFDGQRPIFDYAEFRDAFRIEDDNVLIYDTLHSARLTEYLRSALVVATTSAERVALQAQIETLSKLTPHELGDTKYRRVTYEFAATTRFREYFAAEITQDPEQICRPSQKTVLEIPSTARPATPRVLYALPTFDWETATDAAGTITSVRRGGGLRVYLARPWYSSGDGELLGVVLGGYIASPNAREYPYSTYWGQDPVWRSRPIQEPRASDFARAVAVGERVRLPELEGYVTVAGHEVSFDDDRRLWYCDLDLGTGGAYYPFVRLAFVRYQPHSLEGLNLSPVVLADFVQTVPDRTVTVSRDAADPGGCTISVAGPAYSSSRDLDNWVGAGMTQEIPGTGEIEVQVEARAPEVADETLGWAPTEGTGEPTPLTAGAPDGTGVVTWAGRVTVSAAAEGQRLRLVVREYERIFMVAPGPVQMPGRRLVYLDTIEL